MADKNIKLKTKSGDVLLPVTLASNVSYGAIDSGVSVADKISNSWNKDNLKGSTNITLERQINPNVLDPETTLACFHFDGDATNVMDNGIDLSNTFKSCIAGYTDGVTYPWYNGKKALIFRPTSNNRTEFNMFASSITGIGTTGDFTVEFRVMRPSYSAPDVTFCAGPYYTNVCFEVDDNECVFKTQPTNWGVQMNTNQWYHVVMVRKNGYISLYTPDRRWEHTNSVSSNFTNVGMLTYGYNSTVIYIAELCVWNFAKYDGETLVSPTAPYEMSSTGSVYNITATGLATTSALADKQDTLVSGTNIKTVNNTSLLGSGNIDISGGDSLPEQTGHAGQFLTTDGTDASWATVVPPVPTLTWYTADDWTLSQDGLTLTIADTSSANLVKVYRNGVLLQPTVDYTISGTSLVVPTALTATEKITLEVY